MKTWDQGEDILKNLKDGFNELSQKVNKAFGEIWENETPVEGAFLPRTNLYRTGAEYVWEIELPGVKKESVKLQLQEGLLVLRGEKNTDPEGKADIIMEERRFGRFDRDFVLPDDASPEGPIKAKFDAGLLIVRIARTNPETETDSGQEVPIEF